MSKSDIEWTDEVWNPVIGCEWASRGCNNCYAANFAWRLAHIEATKERYAGLSAGGGGKGWSGESRFCETEYIKPFRWRKPRKPCFVCSMGDLFAPGVKDLWRFRVLAAMAFQPESIFIVLTKRAVSMQIYFTQTEKRWEMFREYFKKVGAPESSTFSRWWRGGRHNLWLGVSVEDQAHLKQRWNALSATPAAKRIISFEPLLGGVYMQPWLRAGIKPDWVICGAETGMGKRVFEDKWGAQLAGECRKLRIPFFFKKNGAGGRELESLGRVEERPAELMKR